MIETNNLTKRFGGQTALNGLTITVEPGEIVCLLGANGAGKTTTLNLLLGYLQPDEGRAEVCGIRPDEDATGARRHIAYVPEMVTLYPNLTGIENLTFFHALGGGAKTSHDELAPHLDAAGLPREAAGRRVSGYSKGMRQKVALAAAFARQAKVWLLDEPFSGLDPHAAAELSAALRQAAQSGVAILMASHDLFRTRELATRAGILREGELVELLDPTTIDHAGLERIYIEHMTDKAAA